MKTKFGFTIETMSDGTLPISTWPGIYPLVYVLEDAEVICGKCANGQNGSDARVNHEDPQWNIVGQQVFWENPDGEVCSHCNEELDCAYPPDGTPTHIDVTLTDSGAGMDYSVTDKGMISAVEILHPMGGRNAVLMIESRDALAGSITLPIVDAKYMVARLLQVEVEDLPTMPGTTKPCRILL
jgi:hypothetical protein